MIDFDQFVEKFGPLTQARFVEANPAPLLLVGEFQVQETTFQTAQLTRERLWSRDQPAERFFVLPLAKRAGSNTYGSMVTFGRAGNNDLVFEHERVSKFHGYFREDQGVWYLCDASSQNGTTVDGAEVEGGDKQGTRLASGAKICLGAHVEIVFYSPEGMHAYCRAKRRK